MIRKRFDPLALKNKSAKKEDVLKKVSTTTVEEPEEDSGSITTGPIEETSISKIVPYYDVVAKDFLLRVPLPEETRSYKPVSHQVCIEDTEATFKDAGFEIISAKFTQADDGRMMNAQYYLQLKGDSSEFGHVVSLQNSYNKRVVLKFAYGVVEWETNIGILSNEISFRRKHTGTVLSEFKSILDQTVYMLTEQREILLNDVKMLKFTKIKEELAQKLMGQLFFKGVVTSSQLNKIRRSFKKKKDGIFYNVTDSSGNHLFKEASVWSVYSSVANVLKSTHAADQIDNFIGAHEFMASTFGLI